MSKKMRLLIPATLLLSLATFTTAQTSRLDESGNIKEDAYIRMPLSDANRHYASIDGARMKQLVHEVADISLANRDDSTRYWGRIAGTKGEEMARQYVEAKFRELGLSDIRSQEFDLPTQWFPAAYDDSIRWCQHYAPKPPMACWILKPYGSVPDRQPIFMAEKWPTKRYLFTASRPRVPWGTRRVRVRREPYSEHRTVAPQPYLLSMVSRITSQSGRALVVELLHRVPSWVMKMATPSRN